MLNLTFNKHIQESPFLDIDGGADSGCEENLHFYNDRHVLILKGGSTFRMYYPDNASACVRTYWCNCHSL